MPHLPPVSRADLIKRLRKEFGFEGPFQTEGRSGGKHPEFMMRGTLLLHLPNDHGKDIDPYLLAKLLDQAGIARSEWLAPPSKGAKKHVETKGHPNPHSDIDGEPEP